MVAVVVVVVGAASECEPVALFEVREAAFEVERDGDSEWGTRTSMI